MAHCWLVTGAHSWRATCRGTDLQTLRGAGVHCCSVTVEQEVRGTLAQYSAGTDSHTCWLVEAHTCLGSDLHACPPPSSLSSRPKERCWRGDPYPPATPYADS